MKSLSCIKKKHDFSKDPAICTHMGQSLKKKLSLGFLQYIPDNIRHAYYLNSEVYIAPWLTETSKNLPDVFCLFNLSSSFWI
jgi:hypothetical protein